MKASIFSYESVSLALEVMSAGEEINGNAIYEERSGAANVEVINRKLNLEAKMARQSAAIILQPQQLMKISSKKIWRNQAA
jgi:hypothetical protein